MKPEPVFTLEELAELAIGIPAVFIGAALTVAIFHAWGLF